MSSGGNHPVSSATVSVAELRHCLKLTERGEFEEAEGAYRQAITRHPFDRSLLLNYALMKRIADQRDEAVQIIEHCAKVCGADAEIGAVRAQLELERGGDAVALFQSLIRAQPGVPEHILGYVSALASEGEIQSAIDHLSESVRQNPFWIDGHNALSKLCWENGDVQGFDDIYSDTIVANPDRMELRLGYCGMLASGQHYERLKAAVVGARHAIGSHRLLDMFEAQAFSETDQPERAEPLFQQLGMIDDVIFAAVRMRSLLRTGRPEAASMLGERFIDKPAATFIWPLLALAWRQCERARWQWLEKFDATVAVVDLEMPAGLLDQLAEKLRHLHTARNCPMDLSARGGTQTRQNLLERSDPEIARLREILRAAVRLYIDRLPPLDAQHPFLSAPRTRFRFSGSWSIRLGACGHHVSHVHPSGWISSALYIVVPEELDAEKREGWLALGGAPPELGLGLDPVRHVEPKPGRLVLFPSIMWHGTDPFDAGERMSVAFDISRYPE